MSIVKRRQISGLLGAIFIVSLLVFASVATAQTASTVELVGVIEQMSVNSITVNQQFVDIRSAEINTPMQVGAVVKVEGVWDERGTIVARQINPVAAGAQPGEAELVGVLESFSGTIMVVNGQTIDVSGAEIKAGVVVGQPVRAHVMAANANTWRAREVEAFQLRTAATSQTPAAGEFEITGTLESIGDRFIVVSGQSIAFTGAEIKGPLLLGTRVRVHVRIMDGQLAAREIENAVGDDDSTNQNTNRNQNTNQNTNQNQNQNQNQNTNQNTNQNQNTAVSAQQAVDTTLRVYPTMPIRSVSLMTRFGGTLVWEVRLANRMRLYIDAATGAILVIDRPDSDDSQNANMNTNDNDDDDNSNSSFNSNQNSNNSNIGSNVNRNQNSNDNDDDHDDDDDNDNDD